jgi:hypothetical protein
MRCFFVDSTLRYSDEKGFAESYYIICPVCWNASIKFQNWEDGTSETSECPVCERIEYSRMINPYLLVRLQGMPCVAYLDIEEFCYAFKL